jgi:hypothetical protein
MSEKLDCPTGQSKPRKVLKRARAKRFILDSKLTGLCLSGRLQFASANWSKSAWMRVPVSFESKMNWLGNQDLNLDSQSQSLESYRWTIPQQSNERV